MNSSTRRILNPKKLLLSKWTAVSPQNKEKHFIVTKLVLAPPPATEIVAVELEAVHSRRSAQLAWRELADQSQWLQGWL